MGFLGTLLKPSNLLNPIGAGLAKVTGQEWMNPVGMVADRLTGQGGQQAAAPGSYNPASGSQPQDFQFQSPLNQSTWSLPSQLTMGGSKDWKNAALGEQALTQQQQMGAAKQQAQSGISGAQNQLAMRGGISSGARERVANAGQSALMGANTQLGMAGAQARAGIGTQAQQMGMAEQQGNITNILGQNALANQGAQSKYNTQMSAWAAGQMADAQRNAAAQAAQAAEKNDKFLGIF